jgi:hypothetical protein
VYWGAAATAQSPNAGLRSASSRSDAARESFVSGLDALHAFEYEDANDAFRRAQALDRGLVMAYWGEALTYHQTLWRHEDLRAGRDALARLERARGAARTPTDAGLIEAAAILFGPGESAARRRAYADAMGRVHAGDRDDPDVAALYALALLGTLSRSLMGHEDTHEGRTTGLAGSPDQTRVAEILNGVLSAHPDHVGALHYLLHAYDDPDHAELGVGAARRLAKAAPASSHALHMPSHMFLQLGVWKDAVASDRAAFDVSKARAARRGLDGQAHNYHALGWLEYELLQRGQYRAAAAAIDELAPVVKASGLVPLLSDLSSMRARFAIETRRWDFFANEDKFSNVDDLFAIGVSAARSRRLDRAERVRAELAARAQSEREGDLRPAIAIMEREVAALIEFASGNAPRAIDILQAATRAELELPPPLGLPEPVKPAPELLGEVLLEAGRASEAAAPFAQQLRRTRNRSLSVLGLARAHAAADDMDKAREQYRVLLANYEEADGELPELEEARRALASNTSAAAQSASTTANTSATTTATLRESRVALATGVGALLAVAAVVAIILARRSRAAAARSRQPRRTKKRPAR